MKFVELDPKTIIQGNSGRLYQICSSDPPSLACSKCCFIQFENYSVCCDNTSVVKEFNCSCNQFMRNDKYFKILKGGL